ncbi:MAG: TetR/AcrR family transcriptional regulator [Deltaproteobacteria bacterium]|nr:TetR/AcrR family transcriptional regulator [Nannocystaceae bacterium]
MTIGSDAEAFREAIIGASLELGQAYGEDGVTMRAIAGKLGTSATTLYTCFDSKASIMRELRVRGLLSVGRTMLDALAIPDARECLLEVSRRYVAFARDNPWLYTVLFIGETPNAEVLSGAHIEVVHRLEQEISASFLEKFASLSGAVPKDPRRLFARWWAAMHGMASLLITRRIRVDHPFLPVGDIDGLIDDYVDGVMIAITSEK